MQGLYRFEYCKMEEPATLCEKLTGLCLRMRSLQVAIFCCPCVIDMLSVGPYL